MYSFSARKIPLGSLLVYVDNPNLMARVATDTKIEFNGKLMSLSGAALNILESEGIKRSSIQGPKMWKYNGTALTKLGLAESA